MKISQKDSVVTPISVESTRARQTPKPAVTFRSVLQTGANVLLAGAKTATTAVGGPLLSAAVAKAGPSQVAQPRNLVGQVMGQEESASDSSTTSVLDGLGQEGVSEDIQLLALQNAIQRRDRQISLVSNVMKSRHDTAKTAIGNIRS